MSPNARQPRPACPVKRENISIQGGAYLGGASSELPVSPQGGIYLPLFTNCLEEAFSEIQEEAIRAEKEDWASSAQPSFVPRPGLLDPGPLANYYYYYYAGS